MSTEKPEVSSKVRDVAEKSLEQARSAIGTLLDAAHKTADTIQTNAKTADTPAGQAVAKGFDFAQKNITAIFDFAQQIVRAPDLSQAVKLQNEFVRTQASTMKDQVDELQKLQPTPGGEAPAAGAASDSATKPGSAAKN